MSITSRDDLIHSVNNNSINFTVDKGIISNTVAGQYFSTWKMSGTPLSGINPLSGGASTSAYLCTNANQGCLTFINPTASSKAYLGQVSLMASTNATTVEIHDRLAHAGVFSGTDTTAQVKYLRLDTTNPGSERIGNPDYSDVQWWVEILSELGSTSVSATASALLDDDTTYSISTWSMGASPRLGRLYPLVCRTPGRHIKGILSITLSASTGTAGAFCTVATRKIATVSLPIANKTEVYNWPQLGVPQIASNAHLFTVFPCTTTSTGGVVGQGKIIYG